MVSKSANAAKKENNSDVGLSTQEFGHHWENSKILSIQIKTLLIFTFLLLPNEARA